MRSGLTRRPRSTFSRNGRTSAGPCGPPNATRRTASNGCGMKGGVIRCLSYGSDPAGNPLDRFGFSRPVWLHGWIIFFTDTASEMVYPLQPLFPTRVLGAGAMSLGVIEGVAEGANSVLKIVSGRIA